MILIYNNGSMKDMTSRYSLIRILTNSISKIAFHKNGRPRKPVRKALFHTNGTVRSALKHFVFDGNDQIRPLFYRYLQQVYQFDEKWYLTECTQAGVSGLDPLSHYLKVGRKCGYHPNQREAPSTGQASILNHSDWVAAFDTPDDAVVRWLIESADDAENVLIVIRCDSVIPSELINLRNALCGLIGINWRAILSLEMSDIAAASIPDGFFEQLFSDPRITSRGDAGNIDENIVIYLESGAIPRPHGVRLLVDALSINNNATIVYGDEDHINVNGTLFNPWFKPAFSPELAKRGMLLGRLVAFRSANPDFRSSIICKLLDKNCDANRLLIDIAVEAGASRVDHIPNIVFHNTRQEPALINCTPPELPAELPVVSIIIPTRDRWDLIGTCLEGLYNTEWPSEKLEIIVVDNGSTDIYCVKNLNDAALAGKIIIQRDTGDFNYARLNNDAVKNSRGDLLILLNNDTKAITPRWLKDLAAYALLPNAGAVGPKLLYEDSTVQHGGVVVGVQGLAAHAHIGLKQEDGGYRNLANVTHEVLAVTGACLAVTRAAYLEVGGLNEEFKVSFNDIVFCMDLYKNGYQNYYVATPLFFHYESKSRGYDNTSQKKEVARLEAMKAWALHKNLFQNDPFYSPCLSLEMTYGRAFAPRRRPSWSLSDKKSVHVLMLSCVHKKGYGVPVVMRQHAIGLVKKGFQVTIGGPISDIDLEYPGCKRINVQDPRLAFEWAITNGVDVIMPHTPPFFSVSRWTGEAIPVVGYDHGEPPPGQFEDWAGRLDNLKDKDQTLAMCSKVFTISDAIKAESRTPVSGVIRLGNSHLGKWDKFKKEMRQNVRNINGWHDRFVVINVCRFHEAERIYKGIDKYIEVLKQINDMGVNSSRSIVFVLCGKGDAHDIKFVRHLGLDARENVSDDDLLSFYAAADAYMNFSTWEGYNLGIGQALALGLPVIASDIPAHRAFGVPVTNDAKEAAIQLMRIISNPPETRVPILWDWEQPVNELATMLDNLVAFRHSILVNASEN